MFTPNQCKAARNLLDWKQSDLAQRSGVGLATIGTFETGLRVPFLRTLKDLEASFKEAGIEFENNDKICSVTLYK